MKTYGIDANVLTREHQTGTERYVYQLLTHMKTIPLHDDERVVLYASKPLPQLGPLPEGWSVRVLEWNVPMKGWTHFRLSWELIRRTPDVFFSPAHELPLFSGAKKMVSTVHDVAFRKFKDVYPAKGVWRQEWAIGRALRHTDRLLTVSETTKKDLISLFGVIPERITVTSLAVDQSFFQVTEEEIRRVRETHHLSGPYFLSIGRIEKKKNILTLVEAYDRFRSEGGEGLLVLGGTYGFGADEIKARIERSPYVGQIRTLGYVDDADIAPLIAGAIAYLFPSFYEGFGIPALESLAVGTPLIASDIPALKEVAADAALYAPTLDSSLWANHMKVVADADEQRRKEITEMGFRRVALFSWQKTAEKTLEVLRRLCKAS